MQERKQKRVYSQETTSRTRYAQFVRVRTRRWGLTTCNTKCKAWYSSVATLYRWRTRARIGKSPRKETRQKGRHTVCANNGKPEGSPRDCRSASARGLARTGGQCEKARAAVRGLIRRDWGCADDRLSV